MGDGKLTVFEYADLDDGDVRLATPLDHARLRQRSASLERDLAELREATREAIAAHNDEPDLGQGAEYDDAVQFARFCMAMDTLAALLPAEPPKEASDGK